MDVTPMVPEGRRIIEGYRPGGFTISGAAHEGSLIVLPEATFPWPVAEAAAITEASLAPVLGADPRVEVLLVGTGAAGVFLPPALRAALRQAGVVAEAMSTGAACRTYNVLLAEGRRVAAALIAIAPGV
jgi:uncharacterized protein